MRSKSSASPPTSTRRATRLPIAPSPTTATRFTARALDDDMQPRCVRRGAAVAGPRMAQARDADTQRLLRLAERKADEAVEVAVRGHHRARNDRDAFLVGDRRELTRAAGRKVRPQAPAAARSAPAPVG